MDKKIIQIISYGWNDEIQAKGFAQSAIRDAEISLLTPATNTPGFVHKNQLDKFDIELKKNGLKVDVIINLTITNCLDWADKSIMEKLVQSRYFRPTMCQFVNL